MTLRATVQSSFRSASRSFSYEEAETSEGKLRSVVLFERDQAKCLFDEVSMATSDDISLRTGPDDSITMKTWLDFE